MSQWDCDCGHKLGAHINPDTGEFWMGSVRCTECEDEVLFGDRTEPECEGYWQQQESAA